MFKPIFEITPRLLELITEATELKFWIDRAVVDVPWLPALQRETAARLAHSSTAIEGNPLSLPDVEALAQGRDVPWLEKDKREVTNYLAAMRRIWRKKRTDPIDEKSLLGLHRTLTAGTLPREDVGRYKTRTNRIVDFKGRTIYTPPPPEKARPLTLDLIRWINGKEAGQLHPVIVGAIAHHRLVSIHPFIDGNGRISRAMETWLLTARGFDTHHLLALDDYYWNDRPRYYQKIQQVRDLDDDLTYWLDYCAEGVVQTLNNTKNRVFSLNVQSTESRIRLTKRQEDLLRFLRDRGRVRSPEIERAFGISRARVGQIIKPLVDAGLIAREGHTRATTYRLK